MKIKPIIIFTVVILSLITFFFIRATSEREENYNYNAPINDNSTPSFQLKLNKEQTNELSAFYLEDYQKDSKIKYTFVLENLALLRGDFEFLGKTMKLYFYFKPIVLENGNVELRVESISLGTLELPSSDILKYVKNNYKIPTWVEIVAKDEIVIMHFDQFKLENGMYFNAEIIDLVNDQIEINVFIPKK